MRPAILVAESEPQQALSVRKLVLETAKFNVLTAHSTAEAIECIRQFPNFSAAVLVEEPMIACEKVKREVERRNPDAPVIVLSAREGYRCEGADYHLSSHDPDALVKLMRKLLGDPR